MDMRRVARLDKCIRDDIQSNPAHLRWALIQRSTMSGRLFLVAMQPTRWRAWQWMPSMTARRWCKRWVEFAVVDTYTFGYLPRPIGRDEG